MKKSATRKPPMRQRSLPAYRELAKALEPLIRKMIHRRKASCGASEIDASVCK